MKAESNDQGGLSLKRTDTQTVDDRSLHQLISACLIGSRAYLFLIFLALALYLPGLRSLPPTDRDEARFIQASRQMVESGDYTRIYFQNLPRHKKPIGIYWLQAASVSLFSTPQSKEVWPYRLPSLLSVIVGILSLFHFGRRLVGAEAAFLAAVMLATCLVVIGEAHLGKSDSALLASTIITQTILGIAYVERGKVLSRPLFVLFWLSLGYGTLVKGPVLPGVLALTVTALWFLNRTDRSWIAKLRPLLGIPIAAAVVLPWFIIIQYETSGQFGRDALLGDILPKFAGVHESHGGFPGYYVLLSYLTFWPWSLFTVASLIRMRSRCWEWPYTFLFAWLVPAWIVLEIVPTKLPHYTLPLYPALALICSGALVDCRQTIYAFLNSSRFARYSYLLWLFLTSVLGAGAVVLPFHYHGSSLWAALVVGLFVSLLPFALSQQWLSRPSKIVIVFVGSALLISVLCGIL